MKTTRPLPSRHARSLGLCVCTALSLTLSAAAVRAAPGDGALHVYFLAVGQGDAALVVAPDGAAMLVDGGGAFDTSDPDPGAHVVVPTLHALGILRLDTMLMTHPHPDHIRGLLAVAAAFPVRCLVHGGSGSEVPEVDLLTRAIVAGGGDVTRMQRLPQQDAWHGVTRRWLHPFGPGAGPHPGWALNDNSVVLHLTYRGRAVLLAADVEARAEADLLPRLPRAELLKVAHHGGRTSSSSAFLQRVSPRLVVISCGRDNPFGVPHAEALARLAAAGVTVSRTDQSGTLHARTDGGPWTLLATAAAAPERRGQRADPVDAFSAPTPAAAPP